jgi:hypothetical protein
VTDLGEPPPPSQKSSPKLFWRFAKLIWSQVQRFPKLTWRFPNFTQGSPRICKLAKSFWIFPKLTLRLTTFPKLRQSLKNKPKLSKAYPSGCVRFVIQRFKGSLLEYSVGKCAIRNFVKYIINKSHSLLVQFMFNGWSWGFESSQSNFKNFESITCSHYLPIVVEVVHYAISCTNKLNYTFRMMTIIISYGTLKWNTLFSTMCLCCWCRWWMIF